MQLVYVVKPDVLFVQNRKDQFCSVCWLCKFQVNLTCQHRKLDLTVIAAKSITGDASYPCLYFVGSTVNFFHAAWILLLL